MSDAVGLWRVAVVVVVAAVSTGPSGLVSVVVS